MPCSTQITEKRSDSDLKRLLESCIQSLTSIGIDCATPESIKFTPAQSFWGITEKITDSSRRTSHYEIRISQRLQPKTIPDKALSSVIIHELLHTCKNSMNHGKVWQNNAKRVKLLLGYNISRVNSDEELGISEIVAPLKYKYIIECPECKTRWPYMKKGKYVKSMESGEKTFCPYCMMNTGKITELSLKINTPDISNLSITEPPIYYERGG